jgi:hypothetical protein
MDAGGGTLLVATMGSGYKKGRERVNAAAFWKS